MLYNNLLLALAAPLALAQAANPNDEQGYHETVIGVAADSGTRRAQRPFLAIFRGGAPRLLNGGIPTIITSPRAGQVIAPNTDFDITVKVPDESTRGCGSGRSISIQALGVLVSEDSQGGYDGVVFSMGVDETEGGVGQRKATVSGGLQAGSYEVCVMKSSIISRRRRENCVKFSVGEGRGVECHTSRTSKLFQRGRRIARRLKNRRRRLALKNLWNGIASKYSLGKRGVPTRTENSAVEAEVDVAKREGPPAKTPATAGPTGQPWLPKNHQGGGFLPKNNKRRGVSSETVKTVAVKVAPKPIKPGSVEAKPVPLKPKNFQGVSVPFKPKSINAPNSATPEQGGPPGGSVATPNGNPPGQAPPGTGPPPADIPDTPSASPEFSAPKQFTPPVPPQVPASPETPAAPGSGALPASGGGDDIPDFSNPFTPKVQPAPDSNAPAKVPVQAGGSANPFKPKVGPTPDSNAPAKLPSQAGGTGGA